MVRTTVRRAGVDCVEAATHVPGWLGGRRQSRTDGQLLAKNSRMDISLITFHGYAFEGKTLFARQVHVGRSSGLGVTLTEPIRARGREESAPGRAVGRVWRQGTCSVPYEKCSTGTGRASRCGQDPSDSVSNFRTDRMHALAPAKREEFRSCFTLVPRPCAPLHSGNPLRQFPTRHGLQTATRMKTQRRFNSVCAPRIGKLTRERPNGACARCLRGTPSTCSQVESTFDHHDGDKRVCELDGGLDRTKARVRQRCQLDKRPSASPFWMPPWNEGGNIEVILEASVGSGNTFAQAWTSRRIHLPGGGGSNPGETPTA